MEWEGEALEPGTEVSAKFRGAFCEAVIRRVIHFQREVKVKFDNEEYGIQTLKEKVCDRGVVVGWCTRTCVSVDVCVHRI